MYKCGACGVLGHNKRACPTMTAKPAPAPDVDLLLFAGMPAPPPTPAPPPAPAPAVSSALDRVFTAPKSYIAPIFGLLRAEYIRTPTAFSINQVPHTSHKDGSMHVTIRHDHPFTVKHRDGTYTTNNSFTLYHLQMTPYVGKSGQTKQRYIALTTIDADKKPITLAYYN